MPNLDKYFSDGLILNAHDSIMRIEFYHKANSDKLWFETSYHSADANYLPSAFRFKCSVLKGIFNDPNGKDKHLVPKCTATTFNAGVVGLNR